MADVIKVTPEKLLATASQMQLKGNEIRSTASQMLSLITGISSNVWSGDAGSAYIGKFRGLEGDTARMNKMISKQVAHLTSIAREYKSTEQKAQQTAAALKNNVLS